MSVKTIFGKSINISTPTAAKEARDHIINKWRAPSDQDPPRGGDSSGGSLGGGIGAGNMSINSSNQQFDSMDIINGASYSCVTTQHASGPHYRRSGEVRTCTRTASLSTPSLSLEQQWGSMMIGNGGKRNDKNTLNAASIWPGTVEFNNVDGNIGSGGTRVYGGDIMATLNLDGGGSTTASPKANDYNTGSGTVRITTQGGHDNIYGSGTDLSRSDFDNSIRVDTFTPGVIAKDKDNNSNLRGMIAQDFTKDYSGDGAAASLDSFITSSIENATWETATVGDSPGKDVYMNDQMIKASAKADWPLYQPNDGANRGDALDGGFPKMKKGEVTSATDPSKKRTYAVLDSDVSLVVPNESDEMFVRDSNKASASDLGKITDIDADTWSYTGGDKSQYQMASPTNG